MRKFVLTMICLFSSLSVAFADGINNELSNSDILAVNTTATNMVVLPATTQTRTAVSECCETINMNSEQLFYLTLAALNKMNYKIKEVQSKTGTVLFQAASREFLVTIANQDGNHTFIKILPADSNYAFSPVMIQSIFSFLKSNTQSSAIVL